MAARSGRNVTPPQIKPWTRIFNMDAGHFDTKTAYAAANTLRLDDMNPHFWRTHDGGKTWTEINNGIAGGAVANSIREDPRKKGLLYAATDTQVWVSFDDGDHWQSLRLNMPAISVRDIAGQGRRYVPVLRSGGRHARPRLLDSRRCDAAAPGGRCRGGVQGVSVQAGDGRPRALRHQRSHAVAAGSAGRGESAAGRAHRLLPAVAARRGEARDSQCRRAK